MYNFEHALIKLSNRSFVSNICAVYRPPNSSTEDFISEFDLYMQAINSVSNSIHNLFLVGDFNITLLHEEQVMLLVS